MPTLQAVNVSKTIKNSQILKNINLKMEGGTVYGFVGRNGSGKTMLFRALSGLMRLSSGNVYYDGKELGKDFSVLPSVGMIIENVGMYSEFTGLANLRMFAKIKGNIGEEEIKGAIRRVGLDPDDKRILKKYSMGMRQRISIAQAIMEKPEVVMLDEPTNGLDEEGVELIRKLILEEKKRGAIILLASHNSEDIRLLADRVYYITDGMIPENEVTKG